MRWPRAMGAVNVAGTSGVLSKGCLESAWRPWYAASRTDPGGASCLSKFSIGDTHTHGIVMKHEGGLNCLD